MTRLAFAAAGVSIGRSRGAGRGGGEERVPRHAAARGRRRRRLRRERCAPRRSPSCSTSRRGHHRGRHAADRGAGCAQRLRARHCGGGAHSVAAQFVAGRHRPPLAAAVHPHVPTEDLVGKRVEYVYSAPKSTSTSISTRTCTRGSASRAARRAWPTPTAATTADRRRALPVRVAREGRPDPRRGARGLARQGLNGKLFGYEGGDFGALSTTPISSQATLLNVTTYV